MPLHDNLVSIIRSPVGGFPELLNDFQTYKFLMHVSLKFHLFIKYPY